MPELYSYAQLFRAKTWEEIIMLAEKNATIKEGIVTLKELSEDEKIQLECEARERYRRDLASATSYGEKLGREEGREEGRQEGREEGYNQMSKLVSILLEEGKLEDLTKISKDKNYRENLMKKYKL